MKRQTCLANGLLLVRCICILVAQLSRRPCHLHIRRFLFLAATRDSHGSFSGKTNDRGKASPQHRQAVSRGWRRSCGGDDISAGDYRTDASAANNASKNNKKKPTLFETCKTWRLALAWQALAWLRAVLNVGRTAQASVILAYVFAGKAAIMMDLITGRRTIGIVAWWRYGRGQHWFPNRRR